MEKSLKLAIARVKRNHNKYGLEDNVLDSAYEYCLEEEEVKVLVEKYNAWIEKNYSRARTVSLNSVLRSL